MAAMTTVLTEFSNNGNSRTSTYTGHTASEPRLVIEKRRVPEGNQTIAEYQAKVVSSTEDSAGEILSSKVSFEATVRYPIAGIADDVTAALAIFRDIIAGDEFGNSVTTQEWLG
jgi:hypothetical protein